MPTQNKNRGVRWQSSFGISLAIGAVVAGLLWHFLVLPIWPAWLGGMSVVTFLVYGMDKFAAGRGWRRTPETALWWLILLGGVAGGWAGQFVFRHKTRKWTFWLVLIVATLFHGWLFWWLYRRQTS